MLLAKYPHKNRAPFQLTDVESWVDQSIRAQVAQVKKVKYALIDL